MSRVRENRTMESILPGGWPRPRGYSQGVVAYGKLIFVAGQLGWNPLTEQFDALDLIRQVRQALENIVSILRQADAGPHHLVRMTWFITDREAYNSSLQQIGQIYTEVIGRHYPAMSVVVVQDLIENGAMIEIEATAVVPE
ncbi:MAG TPA: RidA family protein [Terriglobales bacterium]|nr:RidA family protein [Terriglobales bacterium]